MTILLLLLLAAGVSAEMSRAASSARVLDNHRVETAAFAVAQSGLEQYLAQVGQLRTTDTTMVLPGGRARVRATLFKAAMSPGDTAVYVIRSDGVVVGGALSPWGRRTVGQLAYRLPGRLPVAAIWTTLGGMEKAGASGTITGKNACSTDTIAGVRIPSGTFVQNGEGATLQGKPPLKEMGTQAQMVNQLEFDWTAIANPLGSTLTTDVIVCYPGTRGYDVRRGPCGSWPAASRWQDPAYWPTILVNGSYADLPNGRGLLVVTGDLTFGGGDTWDGIIMVGNRIDDNGGGAISGAVFSGLNAVNGEVVDPARADGTKTYTYDSCQVARAADRQSRWGQISNAWVDNWTSW